MMNIHKLKEKIDIKEKDKIQVYEKILKLCHNRINKSAENLEEYSIYKIYPSTINISISPTKFIARLSNNNQLVGNNGKLIKDKEIDKILPYIFGEFNSKDFLIFKKNVDKSKFVFTEFKTLYFFPSNRWDILTNDNILIKLPQDNFSMAINLAYKIINSEDFKNKKLIDLRANNHLIIK